MILRSLSTTLIVCALLSSTSGAWAQDAVGQWHGKLVLPTGELRLGVDIKQAAQGGLEGSLTSPDQTDTPIPISDIRASGGALHFAVPPIGATFDSRWDGAQGAWVGTFHQCADLTLVLTPGRPAALGLADHLAIRLPAFLVPSYEGNGILVLAPPVLTRTDPFQSKRVRH